MPSTESHSVNQSRRAFLQQSGSLIAGVSLACTVAPRVHAAEKNEIKIALVGCGGRGGGAAADALQGAGGPAKIHALADVFEEKVVGYARFFAEQLGEKATVPKERQFHGLDAYKNAIDTLDPGDVVLLATAPVFRPTHVDYAIRKGINVFMEKSFAVDAPGIRRIQAASQLADEKNIKLACGLMWRHNNAHAETVKRIQDGMCGNIIHMRTYRYESGVPYVLRREDESELAHQIRNFHSFTWTNGSFFLDWCVHNVDICCWAKQAWPESAIGMGGRTHNTVGGQVFDHQHVEYFFPDGTNLLAYARHIPGCPCFYADHIQGTKGRATILGGFNIMKNHAFNATNEALWSFEGPENNPYVEEHVRFFDAIRNDKPYNEGHRAAEAALAGIMGRMAFESGQHIYRDAALASNIELFPNVDTISWDSPPPVIPDENGHYPHAIPGVTVTV